MNMTREQFDEYFESNEGQDDYYDWLVDEFPELSKHGLFAAQENCNYVESFMEYKGVTE